MVNLRESITEYRVRYASLALLDETTAAAKRQSALAALERYFFLIAFAAFVSESPSSSTFSEPFSSWLRRRTEIAKMISRIRKTGHFSIFAPIHDLSAIAKGEAGQLTVLDITKGPKGTSQLVGEEWAQQIIRVRCASVVLQKHRENGTHCS